MTFEIIVIATLLLVIIIISFMHNKFLVKFYKLKSLCNHLQDTWEKADDRATMWEREYHSLKGSYESTEKLAYKMHEINVELVEKLKQYESKDKTLKSLKKVFVELPLLAEQIPKIKTEFNMNVFGAYQHTYINERKSVCETYGCLAGHSARLFPRKKIYYHTTDQFSCTKFTKDVFPTLYNEEGERTEDWYFLFSTLWIHHQPTFEQAIQRLKYYK